MHAFFHQVRNTLVVSDDGVARAPDRVDRDAVGFGDPCSVLRHTFEGVNAQRIHAHPTTDELRGLPRATGGAQRARQPHAA